MYAFGYTVDEDGFPDTKINGFTIYGEAGSEAEAYARDAGFTFVAQ